MPFTPPLPTDPPLPAPFDLDLRPETIVILRLGRLGDVLLTTPAVRALRRRYPDARIVVCTRFPEVYAASIDVDATVMVNGFWSALRALRALRPSLVVDLQRAAVTAVLGRLSGASVVLGPTMHRWHDLLLTHPVTPQRAYAGQYLASVLRVLGITEVDLDLHFPLPPGEPPAVPAGAVGIAPGASVPTRAWAEARWIGLARALVEKGPTVVIWGPPEARLAARVAAASGAVLAPEASITEMARQIGALRLLVGSCSAPRHLAVAQQVPTVTLHGSTAIGAWTRPSPWHRGVTTDLPCRPCNKPSCPIGVRCLSEVTELDVLRVVDEVLALGSEPRGLVVSIRAPDSRARA